MAPASQLDTTTSAVTSLSQTLQQATTAENLFTHMEADVNFINSRVSEVDLLSGQLSKYHTTLQHNPNLHVSRICKLPPETLGEIFKYVCNPTSEKVMTPTSIGAICHHWRQVACSVPQLWTELTVGRRFWGSTYRKEVLNLFFENIGGLCCSITFLYIPGEGGEGPQRIPQETVFDLLFVKYAHKLKAITFHNTPEIWLLHIDNVTKTGPGLPNLESFMVLDDEDFNGNHDFNDSPLALYNAPRLRKLVIESVAQTLIFPWAQLTELSIYNLDRAAILGIVLQCKNLVTLKLQDIYDPNGTSFALPREPIALQNLQRFESQGTLGSLWEKALAEHLLFPSLKQLVWSTRGGTTKLLKKFLLRLPTSLGRLEINFYGENVDIQDLKIIFARLTSLQFVELYLDDPLDVEVVRLFMAADRRHFLPSLRSLSFVMMRQEYNAQQISDILDILRSRWVMHGEKDMFKGPKLCFPATRGDSVKRLEDWIMSDEVYFSEGE